MNRPNERFARLEDALGEAVPLQGVVVEARLLDLLAVVEVAQTYRNVRNSPIEAVYTFPLPEDAVLLDLELRLGERRLSGVVTPRAEAEARYEDALDQGHAALMLQRVDDGLYTLNLGNLMPGEQAVIRFRYGLFQRWNGSLLRFVLPTVIAPRYGDPARAGFMPHQTPETSLDTHYPFNIKVLALGQLAGGRVSSPTHPIQVSIEDGGLALTLARPAALDRDFVLSFQLPGKGAAVAWYAPDGDSWSVWASVRPDLPQVANPGTHSLRLLVDCSGSMSGDSMEQAKAALGEIVGRLQGADSFNLVAFGDSRKALFRGDVPATRENLELAQNWIATLDADMGGTELASAIEFTLKQPTSAGKRDLLLITDGEVWDSPDLFRMAREHRTRIFPVGVGSAPAQDVLKKLARLSGGAAEFVTPNEEMRPRIVRHFERLRQSAARGVESIWPGQPVWRFEGETGRVFSGDTLHVFAGMTAEPKGDFILACRLEDDRMVSFVAPCLQAPPCLASDLPRLVAARRMAETQDPESAMALAMDYHLVSEHTHYLVVAEREAGESAGDLPELAVVPQMLAAGWGGTGTVLSTCDYDMPSSIRCSPQRAPAPETNEAGFALEYFFDMDTFPMPFDPNRFVQALMVDLNGRSRRRRDADWLAWLGAPEELVAIVRMLALSGLDEEDLVKALLVFLLPQLTATGLENRAANSIRHMRVSHAAHQLIKGHRKRLSDAWFSIAY